LSFAEHDFARHNIPNERLTSISGNHSAPHARRKRTPDCHRTAALAATENDLAIGRLRLRSEYTRTSTGRCLDKASAPLKAMGWPLAVDGWRFVQTQAPFLSRLAYRLPALRTSV